MVTSFLHSYSILDTSLEFILENYPSTISLIKQKNPPVLGYFTNKFPVELSHALHITPIRMMALPHPEIQQGISERYIQTFGCSWLRRIIDNGIAGAYPLDAVVFSAGTCDSLQNVYDIWRKVFPTQMTLNMTFPLHHTKIAGEFLLKEFEAFINNIQGRFPDTQSEISLSNSIKEYNQKRLFLQKLQDMVSKRHIPYNVLAKILYIGDLIPVNEFNVFMGDFFLESMEKLQNSPNLNNTPRIAIVGGMWDNWNLYDIPECDGIVIDDLSFGTRNFNFTLPISDSLSDYTRKQIERIPEPTAYDKNQRIKSIESLIKKHKVDGVVFLSMKFCDPDAFELVPIREHLKTLEIPHLSIESTSELSNLNQLRTRLAAFTELLS
jgi:benzoyl-CoA reductase/2-hydroxyglutaryl-CoA dehydratase subunit BcrC/BadD/HgdB